jgi:hypothetical protein
MKLPEIWARCDWCYENAPEMAGHPTQDVAWGERTGYWLCEECWGEMEGVDDGVKPPLVYADDLMLSTEDQLNRLIAAATRRRLST